MLKFDGEDNQEGPRWINKVEKYFDICGICDEESIDDDEYTGHVKDHEDGINTLVHSSDAQEFESAL